MGEVYRATDTKLHRDVAIKVLPSDVAADPDRLARFEREAQVLASLNHPNIAHIHGVDDSSGTPALIMELVDGPTLSDRIAKGPISLDEALPIAKQIAEALEAAHEQGIVHRDLKPANIKVRPDGTVKVLDFGLAKAFDPANGSNVSATNLQTITARTVQGVILGTAAYMSPEQAAGKAIDQRSDLWAFGVVVMEMLTGRPVFTGETVSHVLANVLAKDPDFATVPTATPAAIRRLLRRCLQKDRKKRLDSAADAKLDIDDALAPSNDDASIATPRGSRHGWTYAALTIVGVTVGLAGASAWRATDRAVPKTVYATIDAPTEYVLDEDIFSAVPPRTPMAFTPDGSSLVIWATRGRQPRLFLRPLDHSEARPIDGTEGANLPFVSQDGRWVGFFANGEIKKVPIEGAAVPTVICRVTGLPHGASWGKGDVIVFGDDASGVIMRVSASGGTAAPVTVRGAGSNRRRHVMPVFLPDGLRVLFSDVSIDDAADSRLMVQSLAGGDARLVIGTAIDGRVLPSGNLAFMRLGTLMTVGFDVARAVTTGSATPAMSGVMQSPLLRLGGRSSPGPGMFAVSSVGALAVIRGGLKSQVDNELIWVARDGKVASAEPASGPPVGTRLNIRTAPHGARALVTVQTPTRLEVWLADWARDVWTLCSECASELGIVVWSIDGRRVLISRGDKLFAHSIDGSGADQELLRESDRALVPMAWLPDGRVIYSSSPVSTRDAEIKMFEPNASQGRVLLPLGISTEVDVSPDGRWLAYVSTRAGESNVIVQQFPGPGARMQVSAGGGLNPAWSMDGRTLYYIHQSNDRDSIIYAVEIGAGGGLNAGKPHEVLSRPDYQICRPVRCYEVSPNGQRFLFKQASAKRSSVIRMDLVLNWDAAQSNRR
jgi:serine/threonine-protein kinase